MSKVTVVKTWCLLVCSLWLVSCGPSLKRFSTTLPIPAALPKTESVDGYADGYKDRNEESPAGWADFYLKRRTGGAPLPVEKLLEAKRHKDRMAVHAIGTPIRSWQPASALSGPRPNASTANLGNWEALGPGNIGGRTRALVIRPDDPKTMYAGSEGGGVWKTTDGGNSWNPLTDLLPSLAVASLAMDPKDPNTLYAGTGEYFTNTQRGDSIRGAGIFKTTDGGATWTLLSSTSAFYYVNKIVVSPNNSQHLYAATRSGVYASLDGGATWTLTLDESADNQPGCQDLAIRTDQPTDYLFATCAYYGWTGAEMRSPATDGKGIFRNVDAGGAGKWEQVFTVENMSRTTIALAPSNQSIIYAAIASAQSGTCPTDNSTPPECYNGGLLGVWRSTGNGDSGSWTQQVSNQDPQLVNTLLFTNPREAFADICSGGSTNKSWSNQGDYDNAIAVDPANPDVVWAAGIDLFRSNDGGRNWGIAAFWETDAPPHRSHADNHAIVFHPGYNGAGNQTLYAASDGGVYRTDNALAATATDDHAGCRPYNTAVVWQSLNNGYAATQFYHGSVYPGGGAYMGGAQDNNMGRGSDATGPNAWTIPFPIGDGGFSAIDPTDPNIWFILGTNSTILKTTNGGGGFVAAANGITEPSSNFEFIAPFVMDPQNSKRLYTGGRTLWRTTDQAANWTAASSALPSEAGRISSIAVSAVDPNYVAFGTVAGLVFTSSAALTTDSSVAWTSTQPRAGYVSSVAFDPHNVNTIYVTYSQYKQDPSQSHVYRSTDGGATWTSIDGTGDTGLPDIPVFAIVIDPQNSSALYLGTDIGLFISSDGGATWARDANPFADAVTEVLVLDRSAGQNRLFAFTHGRGVWKTVLPGSGAPCQYSLSGNSLALNAYGSTATLNVAAGDNCTWSAVSASSNFTVGSPAVGQGNGSVTINGIPNNTAQPRMGQVMVQDQSITVTQDPAVVASGNDEMASAFPVSTPAVVIEDTSNGAESPSDPMHSCTGSADFRTLWFTVTAQTAGTLKMAFFALRNDNRANAGAVVTIYRNVNGALGPELLCALMPQTSSGGSGKTVSVPVKAGDSFVVEISATTSGAPAGATLLPATISVTAAVQ